MTRPIDVDRDLQILKTRPGTPERMKAEQAPTKPRKRSGAAMPGSAAAGGPQRRTEGRTGPFAHAERR